MAERLKRSGGSFKTMVLDAAFRALAEAGRASPTITLRPLVIATAQEYQK